MHNNSYMVVSFQHIRYNLSISNTPIPQCPWYRPMLGRKEAYHVMHVVENETTPATSHAQKDARTVTIADIWEAHKFLKPRLHHTPLAPSRTLRDLTGADIYLKAENIQRSGSFKARGAMYKLSRLSEHEYRSGVIAASAGNHAQGVAIAASQLHIPCTIVMPETAPLAKV